MDKTCDIMHKAVDEKINTNTRRLNIHGDRLDTLEQEIIGMKKDTSRLEEILNKLEKSIDALSSILTDLVNKPLKRYEQVVSVIITLVLGYVFGKLF